MSTLKRGNNKEINPFASFIILWKAFWQLLMMENYWIN